MIYNCQRDRQFARYGSIYCYRPTPESSTGTRTPPVGNEKMRAVINKYFRDGYCFLCTYRRFQS